MPFSAHEGAGTAERVTTTSAGGDVGHPAWETVSVDVCAAEGDWLGGGLVRLYRGGRGDGVLEGWWRDIGEMRGSDWRDERFDLER